jgi:MbtH protein
LDNQLIARSGAANMPPLLKKFLSARFLCHDMLHGHCSHPAKAVPFPVHHTEEDKMSTGPFDREDGAYLVLVNEEEQYSLWPESNEIPRGWTDTGCHGDKKTCLDYVGKVWTDMRPKSLRIHMEQHAARVAAEQQAKEQQTAADPS